MATRLLTRSKTLTRTLSLNRSIVNGFWHSLRPLHSLTAPLNLGAYRTSPSCGPLGLRPDLSAASSSPAISFILASKKILGYEKTLPRWFSMNPLGESTSQNSLADKVEPARQKEVTCFSPLEAASIKPRSSGLGNESLKIKRTELSQKITFALIPALLLISKSSLTTSLLVLSVYWQIYGFFKDIFLDYIHQEVTRKWVLIYFKVFLLILVKDTFLDFGLV